MMEDPPELLISVESQLSLALDMEKLNCSSTRSEGRTGSPSCLGLDSTIMVDSDAAFEEMYELGEELGRGAFSTVRVVSQRWGDNAGAALAVKVILKDDLFDSTQARQLREECRALAALRHPNVVELFELIESPERIYLVMGRAAGGELFDRIVSRGHFSEPQAIYVIRQLLEVLAFMHERKIIHRDIKPENILLASADGWDIRVSDFGLVKILENLAATGSSDNLLHSEVEAPAQATANLQRTLTLCGTSYYMAPEVAWPCRRPGAGYDAGVDVWSAGVVLYILLGGSPPWDQAHIPRPAHAGGAETPCSVVEFPSEMFATVSASAKSAIEAMLVVDPRKRPSASDMLLHTWLQPESLAASLKQGSKLSSSYQENMRNFTVKRRRVRKGDANALSSFACSLASHGSSVETPFANLSELSSSSYGQPLKLARRSRYSDASGPTLSPECSFCDESFQVELDGAHADETDVFHLESS